MALAALAAGDFDPKDFFIPDDDKFKEYELNCLLVELKNAQLLEAVATNKLPPGYVSKKECSFLTKILVQKLEDSSNMPMSLVKHTNYLSIQIAYLNITRNRNAAMVCFGCWFAEGSFSAAELRMAAGIRDASLLEQLRGITPIDIWRESDETIARLAMVVAKACGADFIDIADLDQLESHALGKSTIWSLFFQVVLALLATLAGMPIFVATAVAAQPTTVEWQLGNVKYKIDWEGGYRDAESFKGALLSPDALDLTKLDVQAGTLEDHTKMLKVVKNATAIVQRKYKASALLSEDEEKFFSDAGQQLAYPFKATSDMFSWLSTKITPESARSVENGLAFSDATASVLHKIFETTGSWMSTIYNDGDTFFKSMPNLLTQLVLTKSLNYVTFLAKKRAAGYRYVLLPWVPQAIPTSMANVGFSRLPDKADFSFWDRVAAFAAAKSFQGSAARAQGKVMDDIKKIAQAGKAEIYLVCKKKLMEFVTNKTTTLTEAHLHSDPDINAFAKAFDSAATKPGTPFRTLYQTRDVNPWQECSGNALKTRRWILHMEMIMGDAIGQDDNLFENLKALGQNIRQTWVWETSRDDHLIQKRNAEFKNSLNRALFGDGVTTNDGVDAIMSNQIQRAIYLRREGLKDVHDPVSKVASELSGYAQFAAEVEANPYLHIVPFAPVVRAIVKVGAGDYVNALTTLIGAIILFWYCIVSVWLGDRSILEYAYDNAHERALDLLARFQKEEITREKIIEDTKNGLSQRTAFAWEQFQSYIKVTNTQSVTDENGRTITQKSTIEARGGAADIAAKNIGKRGNQRLTDEELSSLQYEEEDEDKGVDRDDQ